MNTDFMKLAIETAQSVAGEIPVGAVVVKDGKVVSFSHNRKEELNDVSAHAEILALRDAAQKLGNWRLNGCDLYVTLEPCPMCMWAVIQSRVNNVYFGAYDTLYGAVSSLPNMQNISNSKVNVKGGIMEEECDKLLKDYFERIR